MTTTSFTASALANPLHVNLYNEGAQVAFISSETAIRTGKVILRVAPKVADKLVKKHGAKIVKILPVAVPALKVIELSVDIYNTTQRELAQDSQSAA